MLEVLSSRQVLADRLEHSWAVECPVQTLLVLTGRAELHDLMKRQPIRIMIPKSLHKFTFGVKEVNMKVNEISNFIIFPALLAVHIAVRVRRADFLLETVWFFMRARSARLRVNEIEFMIYELR